MEIAGRLAEALGSTLIGTRTLAGGFSHETALLTLADGPVVARVGGGDPAIEAAVMDRARAVVPVPEVLLVEEHCMVIEYVAGDPLSEVLAVGRGDLAALGEVVGATIARVGTIRLDRPGFFTGPELTVKPEEPWSQQLPGMAQWCMDRVPEGRLDDRTRREWIQLCTEEAPRLADVDTVARLAHADVNPKNILVAGDGTGWRVTAVLDWEFAYSGCPYGDAANMVRFGGDYPAGFVAGFEAGFAGHQPADLPLHEDWARIGRVLDMFALSDLVTRAPGHVVADQAAAVITSRTRARR
ncbi:phosphotransferase family protein [Symbioplanes lichenis]|uniref:phosphotransferase family protein n=1 Tax=Symbioplanes lichenis TaxID=1629072 RepID=UPI00273862FB|nr:phosphotransferase [Actinoplanes lichenis]